MSADVLYRELSARGEALPGNARAIPFYFLMSHAIELLLKAALLKRGTDAAALKKQQLGHRLDTLLDLLVDQQVAVSEESYTLVTRLGEQHAKHVLHYSAFEDDGETTFTPEPSLVFAAYDELLLAGRTGHLS